MTTPSPKPSLTSLPRLEDLPQSDDGRFEPEGVREAFESFRRHAEFPSESVAAPAFIPGVDWSDHWSFWKEGYPALMVTDTAPYRYPYYHTVQDTPDKVDYERAARIVTGLQRMLRELAGGADAPRQ